MNRFHALIIAFAMGSTVTAPAALTPVLQAAKPAQPIIGNLLGKSRAVVEKALGKPEKSGTSEEDGYDWARYKLAGTKGVEVLYFATGDGLPKTESGNFEVSFDKDATWQSAAKALGLKVATLKAVPLKNILSLSQLVGDPYKGWNVFFGGMNARYPGGDGPGELINDNGGLPMIQFEGRSINDDLPD